MSYLEKLKSKISHPGELPKLPKVKKAENMPTPPTAKTAKRPFDSKDSDRGSRFSENKVDGALPGIEPMTECLHGGKCPHLDAPRERRPVCSKADAPVFDLGACPLHRWAKKQPKLAASPEPAPRNETQDTRQQQAEAGQAVVANIKTDARLINWAKENKRYTYIGRGSKWGNPNREGQHGDRATVCLKYAEGFGRFHEVDELKGRVLGCYCHPLQCHGDLLAALANQ